METKYIGIDVQKEGEDRYFLFTVRGEEKFYDHLPTSREIEDFREEVKKF